MGVFKKKDAAKNPAELAEEKLPTEVTLAESSAEEVGTAAAGNESEKNAEPEVTEAASHDENMERLYGKPPVTWLH